MRIIDWSSDVCSSELHIDRVGDGCAYAALAAEAPRHGAALQQVFEDAFEESIARLVPDDDGSKDARAEAIRGMAQMVGSLVLARAVRRRELAEEILKSGKKRSEEHTSELQSLMRHPNA